MLKYSATENSVLYDKEASCSNDEPRFPHGRKHHAVMMHGDSRMEGSIMQ
jgi:hypothetical protein